MRQAFRRYAFPMMIIAAVLAAALPLNCFAADILYITNDFAFNLLGSTVFNYFSVPSLSLYFDGTYDNLSLFGNADSSPSVLLSSRFVEAPGALVGLLSGQYIDFYLPVFFSGLSSVDFTIYYGLNDSQMAHDVVTLDSATLISSNSFSIDCSVVHSSEFFYARSNLTSSSFYGFVKSSNIYYSSSSFFDVDYIYLRFLVSDTSSLPNYDYRFYVGISGSSYITTDSANVASIIKSISVLGSLLDSHSDILSDIRDQLDELLQAESSQGNGSQESQDILQEGAEKQEELEQLGDALSNVPKPSIENISQSFDPADTMISADPTMVQNALSIVYSWDKFLIMLGLFIAVGTISYIIFGKKS